MQNRYGNWNDNNFFICAAITNLLHLLVLCARALAMNGNRRCTCTSNRFAKFAKLFRIFEAFELCTNSPPKCLQKCHNVSRSFFLVLYPFSKMGSIVCDTSKYIGSYIPIAFAKSHSVAFRERIASI